MKNKLLLYTIVSTLFILTQSASAQGVISRIGSFDNWVVLYSGQAFAVSWDQTIPYNDVSVYADLTAFGRTSETGRAFLTTSLGPGTTQAVASTTFTFPSSPNDLLLFSGLNLTANQYYLSLVGDSPSWGSGWVGSDNPTTTTGPDASLGSSYGFTSPGTPFVPSSPTDNGGSIPDFVVTGTAIPEPSSYGALAAVAAFCFAAYQKHRWKTRLPSAIV